VLKILSQSYQAKLLYFQFICTAFLSSMAQ